MEVVWPLESSQRLKCLFAEVTQGLNAVTDTVRVCVGCTEKDFLKVELADFLASLGQRNYLKTQY